MALDEPLDRIECGCCHKWVLRYEAGAVHTVCPRCGADVAVDIDWLVSRLELDLREAQELRARVLAERAAAVVTVERVDKPVYPRGVAG